MNPGTTKRRRLSIESSVPHVHNVAAAAVSLSAKEGLSSYFRINATRAQRSGCCGKKYAAVSLTAKRKQNERNGKRGTFSLHTRKYSEFF